MRRLITTVLLVLHGLSVFNCLRLLPNSFNRQPHITLFAARETGERKGYYVRPSKAVEEGGGFFIPGLEGEKIRLVSGFSLLAFQAYNQVQSTESTPALAVTQIIGTLSALYIFIKGALDWLKVSDRSSDSKEAFLATLQSTPSDVSLDDTLAGVSVAVPQTVYLLVLNNEGRVLLEKGLLNSATTTSCVDLFQPGSKPWQLLQNTAPGTSKVFRKEEFVKLISMSERNLPAEAETVIFARDAGDRLWVMASRMDLAAADLTFLGNVLKMPLLS